MLVAVQITVDEVVNPVSGDSEMSVMTGLRFSVVISALEFAVPPSVSVAVTVHRMTSSGAANDGVKITELPVPTAVPVETFVQA